MLPLGMRMLSPFIDLFPHSVWAQSLTDRPGNMEGKCSVNKRFFDEASPRNKVMVQK